MRVNEWGMLLALALLWGCSFFFVEIALGDMPPSTIAALRVGMAAAALHLLLAATGRWRRPGPGVLRAFMVMGLLNNAVPFSLIIHAQTGIASGLASIYNATTPLFVVVAAHLLTDEERLTPLRAVGVVTGLAGVTSMIGLDALAGAEGDVIAQIAMLIAACAYALAGIYGRRFAKLGVTPVETAAGQLTGSTLLLLPLALLVDGPSPLASAAIPAWSALAGLALLSTALAYILYFRILATAGATNLLLVTFLIPPTAILLGVLLLDETLAPRHLAGMILIACGLAAIDGRLPARLQGGSGRTRRGAEP